jgi:polyhydroxyalkanoate synthase
VTRDTHARDAVPSRSVGFATSPAPAGLASVLAEATRAFVARPLPVARATAQLATASGLAALRALAEGGPTGEHPWYTLLRAEHDVLARHLRAVVAEVAADPQLSVPARRRLEFLAEQVVAATTPEHWPWSNPAVLRTALDTGGRSLLRGARNALRDLTTGGGPPRQTPPLALRPGRELALTPGTVVFRNRLVEVIQYAPRTDRVHAVPLLVSPPWVNKYYVLDLAPGRSLVEWAVEHGHTVFAMSYRNPDGGLRDLTMGDHLREGLLTALDVATDVTGSREVNVAGLCLGGTLAAEAAAWHAARGERRRIRSLTLLNALLDFTDPGPVAVFVPAATMKAVFDLLRARDLFWGYAVRGWLLGEDAPPSDLLTWNADPTRLPATLHIGYLRSCYLENRLAEGTLELAGERLDLGAVRQDAYVVGAVADHITPWPGVYASACLLGGPVRFVLTTAGHVAGVVNPPDPDSRRRYRTDAPLTADPLAWHDGSVEHPGSWWPDWADWLAERAGPRVGPPATGSPAHPPLEPAPGRYVLQP